MVCTDFEVFEHTADVGLRLARATLAELFRDAAFAMFCIMAPGCELKSRLVKHIRVQADDLEELLVSWLSELNFLFQTELFAPAEVNLKIDNNDLFATVAGEIIDPLQHRIELEIKAITYHKILVANKNGLWRAQVIFDI
ncbi:archease [candidate division KSB1 bacterium]|nr:MAG: archease [candidate division KSB1 bacterium]